MPIVLTRPIVLDDLADIWAYIAEDSPSRADTFIDAVDMKFKELAASPHVGRLRPELLDGLSSFPFGRYIIFYSIISGGIEVVRVLHSARDIEEYFNR